MRWTSRSVSRLLAGALVALAITLGVPGRLLSAPQTTWLVSFTIADVASGPGASSDGKGPYTDYRWPPSPTGPAPDLCVEASPTSTGHLHAVFNRRLDDDTRCNPNGSDRQYTLRLTDAAGACSRLLAAYPDGVVASGDGCELTYTNNPRVRVADLFKKGSPSTTPVAFLAGAGINGQSYEVRMLDSAGMDAPDPNTRTVTYTGQAYLFEFGNGKAKAVEAPFDLPFSMTFVRTAQ